MGARALLLLLLAALPALAGGRGSGSGPAFAARQQTAVLARAGDAAALRCRVLRLAGRTVSWVRSSDLQILCHAGAVFTADTRVSCAEAPDATDEPVRVTSRDGGAGAAVHTLRIERLRAGDAGRYECQLNTEPKMSLLFNLTVVESSLPVVSVRALGPADGAVRGAIGGSAQLACEARYATRDAPGLAPELLAALPALRVRWTHEGTVLDPQSSRGGVSLDTERWAGHVVSRLTLAQLRAADAGRYACSAAPDGGGGGARASLALRLQHGTDAEAEAMQRDQAVARVSAASAARALRAACGAWLALLLPLTLR